MERKRFYMLIFLYGFILSSMLILVTEFVLCNGCIINHIHSQRMYLATLHIRSGIEKVVPYYTRKNNSYISSTFDISGLGNMMFQYASLVGIAHESTMEPIIPEHCKLNKIFKLNVEKWNISRPGLEWGKVVEHKASAFDPVLAKLYIDEKVELVGYFQSWMYFSNTQDLIRKHFRFDPIIETWVDHFYTIEKYKIFKNSRQENIIHIGVHIRRGDMLRKDRVDYGYTVADVEYLKDAIAYYERKFPVQKILFIVSSDDISWARSNFPTTSHHVIFSHGNHDYVDMAILSRCNHSIITTGTFSWWTGWLAEGHVLYYKDYPRNNSRLERSFSPDKRDYYLPNWTGL